MVRSWANVRAVDVDENGARSRHVEPELVSPKENILRTCCINSLQTLGRAAVDVSLTANGRA